MSFQMYARQQCLKTAFGVHLYIKINYVNQVVPDITRIQNHVFTC